MINKKIYKLLKLGVVLILTCCIGGVIHLFGWHIENRTLKVVGFCIEAMSVLLGFVVIAFMILYVLLRKYKSDE